MKTNSTLLGQTRVLLVFLSAIWRWKSMLNPNRCKSHDFSIHVVKIRLSDLKTRARLRGDAKCERPLCFDTISNESARWDHVWETRLCDKLACSQTNNPNSKASRESAKPPSQRTDLKWSNFCNVLRGEPGHCSKHKPENGLWAWEDGAIGQWDL